MRFFKKSGNLKFRKTEDQKTADDWLLSNWEECDINGFSISSENSKKKIGEKKDVGKGTSKK